MLFPDKKLAILHISDLHLTVKDFGPGDTADMDNVYWSKLFGPRAGQADLCIVTGDLASKGPDTELFDRFRNELDRRFKATEWNDRRWLVVPGNSDRQIMRNTGNDAASFDTAFPGWKTSWWKPGSPLMLFLVDSNPDREKTPLTLPQLDFKRGVIGKLEMLRLEKEIDARRRELGDVVRRWIERADPASIRRSLRGVISGFDRGVIQDIYRSETEPLARPTVASATKLISGILWTRTLKGVLLHHHPVGIANTESFTERSKKPSLPVVDCGDFLEFLRDNDIALVCHGHGHVPMRVAVTLPGREAPLAIVGCGSTTSRKADCGVANRIAIDRDASIEVRIERLEGPAAGRQDLPFRINGWEAIENELFEYSRDCSNVSVRSVLVIADIMPTGDMLITARLEGVEAQPDRSTGFEIPIGASSWILVRPPAVEISPPCGFEIEVDQLTTAVWRGRIQIASAERRPIDVTVRWLCFAQFPMNNWQKMRLYGSLKNEAMEFVWGVHIPIREGLTILVRAPGEIASRPSATYHNLEGVMGGGGETAEASELASPENGQPVVEESIDHREIALRVRRPIWGSCYGLSWHAAEARAPILDVPGRTDLIRRELAGLFSATPPASVDALQRLTQEFSDRHDSIEVVLFAITADIPSILVPIAASRSSDQTPRQQTAFPVGAGIAGRAAWLAGKMVSWVRPEDGEDEAAEADWADAYLRAEGAVPHEAVVAMPVPLDSPRPAAILSLAGREKQTGFKAFAVALKALAESDDPDDLDKELVTSPRFLEFLDAVEALCAKMLSAIEVVMVKPDRPASYAQP